MYFLLLPYSFLAGILSFLFFKRNVFDILLFFVFSEMVIFLVYRYLSIFWSVPRRIFYILFFFLGYFIFLFFYGTWFIHNNFNEDIF